MRTASIPAIHTQCTQAGEAAALSLDELSQAIYQALTRYPYCIVVEGFSPLRDRTQLIALVRAIRAKISLRRKVAEDLSEVSFTEVYINHQAAEEESGVTQYSRTHLPLPPHTDSSYLAVPHEIVVFHCVEADSSGGKTIMVPVDDILQRLDNNTLALLRESVYPFVQPFKQGCFAVICGSKDNPLIRYYQAQVERALALGATLSAVHQAALDKLDTLLAQTELFYQFPLEPGQILFMHNHKVMHGRTALSPQTNRLLYRLRLHTASLSFDEQIASARDAHSHMALARELAALGRIENATAHYQQASKLSPQDSKILNAYGSFLLKTGRFDRAADIFRRCLTLDPLDYDSALSLSSLARMAGNQTEAIDSLRLAMRDRPFVVENEHSPERPTLLRMRAIEGAAYSILEKADGTFTKLLRGGHFSISDLLSGEGYNLLLLNIFENNVDTLEEILSFDLIINTIACPDAKGSSLLAAARFVDSCRHCRVINHPRQVIETSRDRNSQRLNSISGVTFPKTEKIWWAGGAPEQFANEVLGWGFKFPVIVREVGSQTGKSVALLDDRDALCTHIANSPADQSYYVIQFQDCSIRPNVYHKMRVFFIDGVLYPVANVFDSTWNIHSGDRYRVMHQTPWMQAEERAFLSNPSSYLGSENFNRLRTIKDLIRLDFFGIDFTVLPDKTLFIFEVNAAMRHNFDHAKNFSYTKPYLETISQAFEQMVKNRLYFRLSPYKEYL